MGCDGLHTKDPVHEGNHARGLLLSLLGQPLGELGGQLGGAHLGIGGENIR